MNKNLFALLAVAILAIGAAALAADPDTTTRERWRVLADPNPTNATVTTQYTAAGPGQLLTGRKGVGTNTVWISTAAGTNAWQHLVSDK